MTNTVTINSVLVHLERLYQSGDPLSEDTMALKLAHYFLVTRCQLDDFVEISNEGINDPFLASEPGSWSSWDDSWNYEEELEWGSQ